LTVIKHDFQNEVKSTFFYQNGGNEGFFTQFWHLKM